MLFVIALLFMEVSWEPVELIIGLFGTVRGFIVKIQFIKQQNCVFLALKLFLIYFFCYCLRYCGLENDYKQL